MVISIRHGPAVSRTSGPDATLIGKQPRNVRINDGSIQSMFSRQVVIKFDAELIALIRGCRAGERQRIVIRQRRR